MSTNTNRSNTDSGFAQEWLELANERSNKWGFKQIISHIWHSAIELFAPSSGLRIFAGRDQYGNTYYQVYDVLTQGFYRFGSEDEVRVWFEQRYYR